MLVKHTWFRSDLTFAVDWALTKQVSLYLPFLNQTTRVCILFCNIGIVSVKFVKPCKEVKIWKVVIWTSQNGVSYPYLILSEILDDLIWSDLIWWYRILTYVIFFDLILPCLILSYIILSYFFLYKTWYDLILPYLTVRDLILSYLIWSDLNYLSLPYLS